MPSARKLFFRANSICYLHKIQMYRRPRPRCVRNFDTRLWRTAAKWQNPIFPASKHVFFSGSRHCASVLQTQVQPIPLGVTFSKAQSSNLQLERLFCHVSVKRDVRALSFELRNSIRKCHCKWDWLYEVVHNPRSQSPLHFDMRNI